MAAVKEPTPDVMLRPTAKLLVVGYAFVLILAIAIVAYWRTAAEPPSAPVWWPLMIPGLLLIWLLQRHLTRRSTRLSVVGDRLRYEAGIFSKVTRTMEIQKVQDVRVDQTLGQRILGIGNLSVETAGDASRIVIESVDSPQAAAERILDLARRHAA